MANEWITPVTLSSDAVAVLARAKEALTNPALDRGEWFMVDSSDLEDAADALTEAGLLKCQLSDEGTMLFSITDAGLLVWLIQARLRRKAAR